MVWISFTSPALQHHQSAPAFQTFSALYAGSLMVHFSCLLTSALTDPCTVDLLSLSAFLHNGEWENIQSQKAAHQSHGRHACIAATNSNGHQYICCASQYICYASQCFSSMPQSSCSSGPSSCYSGRSQSYQSCNCSTTNQYICSYGPFSCFSGCSIYCVSRYICCASQCFSSLRQSRCPSGPFSCSSRHVSRPRPVFCQSSGIIHNSSRVIHDSTSRVIRCYDPSRCF